MRFPHAPPGKKSFILVLSSSLHYLPDNHHRCLHHSRRHRCGQSNSREQAALLRNETEENIITSVGIIDDGLKLFDNSLNHRMEESFVLFHQAYCESGGDPSLMNLSELKRELGGEMELYIINGSGVVEYTTYHPEKDLDFKATVFLRLPHEDQGV